MFTRALGHCVASTIFTTRTRGQLRGNKEWPFCGVTNASRVWRKGAGKRGLKAPLGWRGDMSQSEYAHLMFTYSSNNDTDVHGSSWRLSLLIYVSVCSFQCCCFLSFSTHAGFSGGVTSWLSPTFLDPTPTLRFDCDQGLSRQRHTWPTAPRGPQDETSIHGPLSTVHARWFNSSATVIVLVTLPKHGS